MSEFARWLSQQHHRNDAVGLLAHASLSDTFPLRSWRLYVFLRWAGADPVLRYQVKTAHREWRHTL